MNTYYLIGGIGGLVDSSYSTLADAQAAAVIKAKAGQCLRLVQLVGYYECKTQAQVTNADGTTSVIS